MKKGASADPPVCVRQVEGLPSVGSFASLEGVHLEQELGVVAGLAQAVDQ